MLFNLILLSGVLAAVLPPFVLVKIRESVKIQRQETIKDLQTIFELPDTPDKYNVVASFEFVKYKYFLKRAGANDSTVPMDFKSLHWILSSVPLILTMFFMNVFCLCIILHVGFRLNIPLDVVWLNGSIPIPLFAWVVLSAYSGGYIFMIRAYFRAINNFDLSPLSFMGGWINLILGVTVSLIFIFGFLSVSKIVFIWTPVSPQLFSLILLSSFAIGYMPALANRNILRASQLRYYKKEDEDVYKSFTAIPVEVIDGIDTDIRERLADYHISAVQNLAAANPLMLFVETPYGVYQIMDWVAQAQLCCSVGPTALVKLWQFGIRTIFDLERLALDPSCRESRLLTEIGKILISPCEQKAPPYSNESIIADILIRLESPHVRRLRQLFVRVSDRLGDQSKRLPPVLDCPADGDRSCPFVKQNKPNGSRAPAGAG